MNATALAPAASRTVLPELRLIPIEQLKEHPLNVRKTFPADAMAELAASIREKGIQTPLLVRPHAKAFEIIAGHRRYRCAKTVGLPEVPVLVRELSDDDTLELLLIDNLQRADLHPLEEAEGYRTLMTRAGYSAERLAERRGCSEKYIYDRVKLLQLIPEAQKLFLANTITAGHAILLARLKPEDQKRIVAIDREVSDEGVLLKRDAVLLTDDEEDKLDELADRGKAAYPLTPISVRELERYIAEHVRFKPTETDAFLFPDTASDSALLEFVRDHPLTFRLDKVDQTWFMDLITSGGLIRKALADERELETA